MQRGPRGEEGQLFVVGVVPVVADDAFVAGFADYAIGIPPRADLSGRRVRGRVPRLRRT